MKRIGFINMLFLALAGGLCLLIATASDGEVASIDLRHPTTFVSVIATRVRAIPPYVGKLINNFTAGFRDTVQKHEGPKKSLEP